MASDFKFRWVESGEKVQPYTEPVRSRGHADPTADAAIGHIIAEEKRERRRKERQRKKKHQPKNGYKRKDTGKAKTSVWRNTDRKKN